MPIMTYKEMFGNHRQQMVEEVYHKCGLCGKDVFLDSDDIKNHLFRHGVTQKVYNAKFLVHNKTLKTKKKKNAEVTMPVSILETLNEIEDIIDAF